MELTDKFDRSVSMLAWGYNEEELVEDFLDRAFALLEKTVTDYELVFVDDCSTDGTGRIVADYARREPRLRVITHETNLNVGFACRRAVAEARKDFLFWQTVDWSYDLTYLRVFLELLKHFDVVQGIRPAPERLLSHIPVIRSIYRIKSRSDNLQKAVVSLSNYYLLRLLYGVKFHDFQNVTFYPAALVQSLTLVGKSSFINPELLLKTHARGARFLEVPIPVYSPPGRRCQGDQAQDGHQVSPGRVRQLVRLGPETAPGTPPGKPAGPDFPGQPAGLPGRGGPGAHHPPLQVLPVSSGVVSGDCSN